MADKEERLWLEFDIPKPKGAIKATRCTTMTRQEAIEKMAKAMAAVSNITYVSEGQWKVVENGFRISAEAALNALLEDK